MSTYWKNYVHVLKKYAIFEGKAGRPEFWMYVLVNIIFGFIAGLISPAFWLLYALFSILPGLAVSARRLHDIGQSAWWLLIGLIPFLGALILLILFVQPSKHSA